ncbi:hypothetical protein Hanom_Chr06g00529881 [Helianthus anomalus]
MVEVVQRGSAVGGGGAAVVGVVHQGWRCFDSGCAVMMVVRWWCACGGGAVVVVVKWCG